MNPRTTLSKSESTDFHADSCSSSHSDLLSRIIISCEYGEGTNKVSFDVQVTRLDIVHGLKDLIINYFVDNGHIIPSKDPKDMSIFFQTKLDTLWIAHFGHTKLSSLVNLDLPLKKIPKIPARVEFTGK